MLKRVGETKAVSAAYENSIPITAAETRNNSDRVFVLIIVIVIICYWDSHTKKCKRKNKNNNNRENGSSNGFSKLYYFQCESDKQMH